MWSRINPEPEWQQLQRQHQHEEYGYQDDGIGFISGSVFSMLPAAMPNLRELFLQGSCLDAALPIFGASCPALSTLSVQALQVSCCALHDFGVHLPHLTSLTLWSNDVRAEQVEHFRDYLSIVLPWAGPSKTLTALHLDFPPGVELICEPEPWNLLPATLQYLRCPCLVEFSEDSYSEFFGALLRRIPTLWLQQPPCLSFLELLAEFPVLESFTQMDNPAPPAQYRDEDAEDPQRLNIHCNMVNDDDMAMIQERFTGGQLHLECNMNVMGTCKDIDDALKVLPPFPHVRDVRVFFTGRVTFKCLKHLSRVFPKLVRLTLRDEGAWEKLIKVSEFEQLCESLLSLTFLKLEAGMCVEKVVVRECCGGWDGRYMCANWGQAVHELIR